MTLDKLIALTIAVLPAIIILIRIASRDPWKYILALLGAIGWFVAYILRVPILIIFQPGELALRILFAALMAGIFEETTRFLMLRFNFGRPQTPRNAASFGIG